MNDKRFKDLLFEFNNIEGATLTLFLTLCWPASINDDSVYCWKPTGDYVIEGNPTPIMLKPANTQITVDKSLAKGLLLMAHYLPLVKG